MRSISHHLTALTLAVAVTATAHAAGIELQISFTEAGAYAFDSGFGAANDVDDRDAWRAEASVGVSTAEMNLGTGLGKLYTADPAGSAVRGGQASVGFFFSVSNPGDLPVTFAPRAITVDVDAVLAHSVGVGIEGVQMVAGGFFRVGGTVDRAGQSLLGHNFFVSPLVPGGTLLPGQSTTGNAILDVRANAVDAIDYTMSFEAVTIAPRGRADFEFEFAGSVTAGEGSHAAVDALSTVRLRMVLPEGVTLTSEQPVAWVTAVPEPSTSALLLGGIALLGVAARRRKCNDQ